MYQALTEAVYYILLSLLQPMHGYGIMQNVEKWSRGRMRLAAGTLYGAMNTLMEKGWIRALPEKRDSRKKVDLCQYFRQKKSKGYAAFLSSSSSFCWGVI